MVVAKRIAYKSLRKGLRLNLLYANAVWARYVSHRFWRDWLLHSYKLNRVRDTERLGQDRSLYGRLYAGHGPPQNEVN